LLIYADTPIHPKANTAMIEIIILEASDLPSISLNPPNIRNTGQKLRIYIHTFQLSTPVVLRRNIVPKNIRNIAPT
jgi:hypothetical protein